MLEKLEDFIYVPDMPQDKKVKKIMIIGAGGIISDCHLPAYRLAGYDVAGIYDRAVEKAEALAKEYGIPKAYGEIESFLADAIEYDAVFDIALPASALVEILPQLPDGAGVLMQKPMGESLEEAKMILDICHAKKFIAGVNFQLRQAPYVIAAKEFIDSGKLGEIVDIEIRETANTPWHLWTFLYGIERMEINYHSIHYVDLMRYLIGDPKKVLCKTMKHPNSPNLAQVKTNIILDYGDTLRAGIVTNHNHVYGLEEQESQIKIEGTKGAMKIVMGVYLDYPKGLPDVVKVNLLEDGLGWRDVEVTGSWFPEAFTGTMGGLLRKFEDPTSHFVNNVDDAYKTMCLVETCYQSDAEGGTMLVKDTE
ncbi:MAG: Gfo/Idh/MocA family oxidoreductase [Lachnospiraceae bacterium]